MNNIFIFLLALIVLFTSTVKAQQYFPDDEIDTETDAEVVSVEHKIHKRSIPEISIKITNRGTESEFILQSSDGFFAGKDTKVWIAKKVGNKFIYTLQREIMKEVNITFYQDVKSKSAIAHTVNEDGTSEFNGVINSNKIIRSLNNHDRKRRDLSSELLYKSANNGSKNYHLLHKREVSNNNNYHTKNTNRQKVDKVLQNPKIVYPEILVFVDVALFRHHNKDIVKTVAYVLTLFNGADLYFRELSNPIFRLNIAGIVVCQGIHRIVPMHTFDASRIQLDEFGKFLFKEEQFKFKNDYDVAILLGKRNPIVTSTDVTEGRANVRCVCQRNEETKMIMSTVVVVDNTILSGVHTSAHELSHLFGSEHDNFDNTTLSEEDKESCSFKKGFIMSYKRHDQNQFYYSKCSKEMMRYTLSRPEAICLQNDPGVNRNDNQILRILPGQYITLDEQCQKRGYTYATPNVDQSVCLEIICITNTTAYNTIEGALDGTPCDTEKVCLRGECVKLPFDKNPDIKLLFPILYQELKTNKSAEEQCTKLGYNTFGSFIKDCYLHCTDVNANEKTIRHGPADDGTVCNINGVCKNGQCVDDFYKLAEDHCKRSGQSALYRVNNIREKKCKIICEKWSYNVSDALNNNNFDKNIFKSEISAPDGISCDNNAHCQDGQCVDISSTESAASTQSIKSTESSTSTQSIRITESTRSIEISTSTESTTSSFFETSTIDINVPKKIKTPSEQCEEIGLPFIETYNDGCITRCDDKNSDDNKDLIAPEGYPCLIDNKTEGHCQDGQCVDISSTESAASTQSIKSTESSTSTQSIRITESTKSIEISTSTESTTSSFFETSTIDINVPKKIKTPSEQCEEIGLPFIETYNDGCITRCDDKNSDDNKDLDAPEGYPCLVDNKTEGYCIEGICLVEEFNTTTVSIIVSTTSSNKLSDDVNSLIQKCNDVGFKLFSHLEKFNCTIVCSNENNLDYDDEDDDDVMIQELYQSDGSPCMYNGHCLEGQCVNMIITNPNEISNDENEDAFVVFNKLPRKKEFPKVAADVNSFNNGENEEDNAPIDLSDIDDDIKEFADDLDVDI
ncbi:uncharacterized protein LOC122504291 [Leptopilina heterotoma]|uniref:uncharacterized protein LOC122504291 n=1 Tax=Leptopilina heterotoma TaxID=63436 RepID=UPI001CA81586|nr:uncharacterized protein LOC122504291 [Leptopilina heterotoma]